MKKISDKNGILRIQLTEEEVEGFKRSFQDQVDSVLSDKYKVTLPLYAIKKLLHLCIKETQNDIYMREHSVAFGNKENILAEANEELIYVIAAELKKHKLDWKLIFQEINEQVKKEK